MPASTAWEDEGWVPTDRVDFVMPLVSWVLIWAKSIDFGLWPLYLQQSKSYFCFLNFMYVFSASTNIATPIARTHWSSARNAKSKPRTNNCVTVKSWGSSAPNSMVREACSTPWRRCSLKSDNTDMLMVDWANTSTFCTFSKQVSKNRSRCTNFTLFHFLR